MPDPVRAGTAAAFERTYADLERRVDRLAPIVRPPRDETTSGRTP